MTEKKLTKLERKLIDSMALLNVLTSSTTLRELSDDIMLMQEKYKALTGDYLKVDFERKITYRDFLSP